MDKNIVCIIVLLSLALVAVSAAAVMEDGTVTIICPLDGNYRYPMWTGPETLATPFMTGNVFTEQDIQWADNKLQDIKITKAMLKHDGTYTCQDDAGRKASVELNVEYFKMPSINIATDSNNRTTLTCGAFSNPSAQIPVTLSTSPNPEASSSDAIITYNGCQPDRTMENRDYCSVTAVWYMWKKDNGKEQICTFIHNNVTQITLTKKAYFNFPPTMVKITGNKPSKTGAILTLTCSTDSSYPVSSLEWRKGTKTDINENDVINNNIAPVVMDAEYNGKNISQNLGLAVTRAMNGQRVSCCAADVCDSVILAIDTTSAGVTVTAWMTLLVACLIFISQLQN